METIATILMLVGVVAPLVGLVMFVISLIKKKAKKKPLIILLAGILCFIIGGIMMPSETPEPEVQNPTANETSSIDKIIKNGVLQYPASNEVFKYNVYDTYVEVVEYIGSQDASSITVPATLENLPVYVVDANAFRHCKVPTIIFEDGIYAIQNGFSSSSFVNVTLPSTLRWIGALTFKNCFFLEKIVIPEGIDSIQYGAFQSCSSLKEITIPSTVTSIDKEVFAYCTKLAKVNLPNGLKTIGEKAFIGCENLKSIDIPDTVEEIKFNAFQSTGLVSVEIPASVTKIGANAFLGCDYLKEVKVHNSDVTIEPYTYYEQGIAMGTSKGLFSQCNEDLVVYGKPASAIARACAEDNVYFKPF